VNASESVVVTISVFTSEVLSFDMVISIGGGFGRTRFLASFLLGPSNGDDDDANDTNDISFSVIGVFDDNNGVNNGDDDGDRDGDGAGDNDGLRLRPRLRLWLAAAIDDDDASEGAASVFWLLSVSDTSLVSLLLLLLPPLLVLL
jgi:hypothetical protein